MLFAKSHANISMVTSIYIRGDEMLINGNFEILVAKRIITKLNQFMLYSITANMD